MELGDDLGAMLAGPDDHDVAREFPVAEPFADLQAERGPPDKKQRQGEQIPADDPTARVAFGSLRHEGRDHAAPGEHRPDESGIPQLPADVAQPPRDVGPRCVKEHNGAYSAEQRHKRKAVAVGSLLAEEFDAVSIKGNRTGESDDREVVYPQAAGENSRRDTRRQIAVARLELSPGRSEVPRLQPPRAGDPSQARRVGFRAR